MNKQYFKTLWASLNKPGGYREIWRISYPLIIMAVTHSIMQFIDRKFLSIESTEYMAAALPGGILCITFMTFFSVTTGFTATFVSQYHGQGNREACARVPWSGFVFAVVSGIVCCLIMPSLGMAAIRLANHPPVIAQLEWEYFRALIPSTGFMYITIAFSAFFSGLGKTWYVTIIHFLGCLINIVLDYVLIFGHWGAPRLGIVGAGSATTLSYAFTAIIALIFFLVVNQRQYPTRAAFRKFSRSDFRQLVVFGSPSGLQALFSTAAFSFIVFLIGDLGGSALAATTIAISINILVFLPLQGMSQAISVIVGKYIGQERLDIAERAVYRSFGAAVVYMTITGLVFICFPYQLIMYFQPDSTHVISFKEVLYYGRPILMLSAVYNLFNAVRFIFNGGLRGAGDNKVAMWISIACAWGILVPGGLLIIRVYHMSLITVWTFICLYTFLLGLLLFWRFRSGAWKKVKMIKQKESIDESIITGDPVG